MKGVIMSKSRNDRLSKERRQSEAKIRNEKWAALTPQQQIKKLDELKHNAFKQRNKIQKKVAQS
jgi:Spy/CpxP family protein refolding chaperone